MTDRTLQLVFDPNLASPTDPSVHTVLCFQQNADQHLPGDSLKAFCDEHYAELGREVGLWWFRRFSVAGRGGSTLHDLFAWEGVSALWFTRNLFLYEDYGIFLMTLVAIRSLELLEAHEVSGVQVVGGPHALARVFEKAGYPCEFVPPKSSDSERGAPVARLMSSLRGLYRRFLLSRSLRNRFADQHRPGQGDTLLYSVVLGEWNPGGTHRYLEETVAEFLEIGGAKKARPVVYGIPPAYSQDSEWREFLEVSLRDRGGIYPMGEVSFSEFRKLRSWVSDRIRLYHEWAMETPEPWSQLRGWDLSPLIAEGLSDLAIQLERGLLMYVAFKKTFESIRPKGFLLKDEVYPHGRILIAAARAAGIPSFSLQHGSIYPTHWCYLLDPEAEGVAQPPLPDVFGVYGSAIADLLAEHNGFPREVLKVVGARRFRELDRMVPSQPFLDLKAQGKPLILVAGQLHQDMPKVYAWLFALAERNPHQNFVFKPHPRDREGIASVQSKCATLPNARVFSGPIGDILPAVDLVVSCHSTVLLEAVWLGIGGISVLASGEKAADWQERAGLLKIARSPKELSAMLENLSAGKLFSAGDREKSKIYLEDFLGYSEVRERDLLKGIFEGVD